MEQQQENLSLFGLSIDPESRVHLAEAARWGKFLAIVGFIFCALIALGGIFAASLLSSFSSYRGMYGTSSGLDGMGSFVTVMYLLMALLYFFPCLFLYRFATKLKFALATNQQDRLNASFQNLKALFRFLGILTIIFLVIFGLTFLTGILTAATLGS